MKKFVRKNKILNGHFDTDINRIELRSPERAEVLT